MTAVVLSCMGAPEGDLNLVRSLGEAGVPVIVIAESAQAPVLHSRHCGQGLVVPGYTTRPQALVEALRSLRERLGHTPVAFPSADPDLRVLVEQADALYGIVHNTVQTPALCAALSDKEALDDLARRHNLPVPVRHKLSAQATPESDARAALHTLGLPLVLKPAQPNAWSQADLPAAFRHVKALVIHDSETLLQRLRELGPVRTRTLAQACIVGEDPQHYEVHAYIDRHGRPVASFCGRKWRVWPPHAGSGCHVESVAQPELVDQALAMLQAIGFRGIANIDYKQDVRTGRHMLLEINPRVSQWHILTTRCGINLPHLAYLDALHPHAAPLPTQPLPRTGLRYVNGRFDWHAAHTYRTEGTLSWGAYLASLLPPGVVYQSWQAGDLGPALFDLGQRLGDRAQGLRRALGWAAS
jgi:predicted ATP-grasp superfamily ATP-dependent carboligase